MTTPILEIKLSSSPGQHNATQLIRQMGSLDKSQSLTFTYPVIIDKSLQKYEGLVRDFFSLQFINSIKESSALNIISTAVSIGSGNELGKDFDNPAEKLTADLGKINNDVDRLTTAYVNQQSNINYNTYQSKQEYQDKINSFREMIAHQIAIDPKYENTRPHISTVPVNNLVDIPLILATKSMSVPTNPLYWVLFASIGLKAPLSKSPNLERIKEIIRNIPADNYMSLLDPKSELPTTLRAGKSDHLLNNIIKDTEDKMDKVLKMFDRVLNPAKVDDYDMPGVVTSDSVSISRVMANTAIMRNNLMRSAAGLYSAYISDDIVNLLQSITHAVNVETDADVSKKLNIFTNIGTSQIKTFYDHLINNALEAIFSEANLNNNNDALLDISKNICDATSKMAVRNILTELNMLSFSIKGNSSELADFIEKLVKVSSKLSGFTNQLKSNIIDLGRQMDVPGANVGLNGLFNNFKNDAKENVDNYFIQRDGQGQSIIDAIGPNLVPTNRFMSLLGGHGNINKFISTISESISELMMFMSLYSFQSYYCEYLSEVHAEVMTQKKGALEFPNYLLVLPSWMITGLYNALAAKNFKELVANQDGVDAYNRDQNKLIHNPFKPRVQQPTREDRYKDFKTHEREIRRMIPQINKLLGIPNLVVIDDKKKELYYNWMYMNKHHILSVNMKSLTNYINNQFDINPGF